MIEINPRAVHVIPDGVYWSVKGQGQEFPSGTFITKVEAMALAIRTARDGQGLLVVHGKNGRFQEVRSYAGRNYPSYDV